MELNIIMTVALGLLGAAAIYLVVLFKRGKTKEIYSIIKNKIPQGVIGIYSVGEKRVSVIRVENNYFCRLIPENSIENE